MNIIKVRFIYFSLLLIPLSYSHAESVIETDASIAAETESSTQMLAELVDVVVTEIEDVVEVEPLKTKSRQVEVIADDEFSDFMYEYPGLIEKLQTERLASRNPYVLLPHKPNYFMPLSYQTKINQEEQEDFYNAVRAENSEIEQDPSFEHTEFVFQLSVKYIVAENFLGKFSSLAVAYTNKSFWQSYNNSVSALFRETNHEPEIILGFNALEKWVDHWTLSFNHQSNGQVGNLSRSWNRIILGGTKIWTNKLLYVRAWYRIPETSKADPMDPTDNDNPDINDYLGYGDIFYLRKFGNHSVSATVRNNLNFDDNLGSIELDWTYPLPGNVKGFVQYFNGYGESLIDYNQYQERIGIGIKITDWL
ncbi:MAG: phospholipase A [Oleispira antarctica]|uniref:Phospholipase A1 n=1 Tax=Oleispira antarctica RB-8 TaxID=698738 RepID=R4YUR5_OLEAN|nr:phospholipase A [Oleispira antarctica]MBQ0792618.1 phospholipase A [Oleispira antarctica]CCK76909.1 Putative outer membrane phospholipase A(1) [Oleispira antarctica RB-8]